MPKISSAHKRQSQDTLTHAYPPLYHSVSDLAVQVLDRSNLAQLGLPRIGLAVDAAMVTAFLKAPPCQHCGLWQSRTLSCSGALARGKRRKCNCPARTPGKTPKWHSPLKSASSGPSQRQHRKRKVQVGASDSDDKADNHQVNTLKLFYKPASCKQSH